MTFSLAPAQANPFFLWGLTGLLLVPLIGLMFYLSYAPRHVQFEVTPEELRIRGDLFYGRTIPRGRLLVDRAARADITKNGEYQLTWRTYGTAIPGYRAGWFRLKQGGKALVFLSDPSRAVAIPTSEQYTLLISPADPDAFLAQVRGQR